MIILFGVAMKKSIFFNPTAVYFLLEFLLQQFRLAALSQSSPLVCFPCLHFPSVVQHPVLADSFFNSPSAAAACGLRSNPRLVGIFLRSHSGRPAPGHSSTCSGCRLSLEFFCRLWPSFFSVSPVQCEIWHGS
jgi:hypothetical protein